MCCFLFSVGRESAPWLNEFVTAVLAGFVSLLYDKLCTPNTYVDSLDIQHQPLPLKCGLVCVLYFVQFACIESYLSRSQMSNSKRKSSTDNKSLKRSRYRPNLAALPFPKSIRPVTSEIKQIILDRLEKEIATKCSWSPISKSDSEDDKNSSLNACKRKICRSRFTAGVNQCTRILEDAIHRKSKRIQLLILCKDSINILCHIPPFATKLNIPLVILSGKAASLDLGKAIGCNRTSLCLFSKDDESSNEEKLDCSNDIDEESKNMIEQCHNMIDSFLSYIIKLI